MLETLTDGEGNNKRKRNREGNKKKREREWANLIITAVHFYPPPLPSHTHSVHLPPFVQGVLFSQEFDQSHITVMKGLSYVFNEF